MFSFGFFSGIFRVYLSISFCTRNSDVGVVFWAYLGFGGVFFSVAGPMGSQVLDCHVLKTPGRNNFQRDVACRSKEVLSEECRVLIFLGDLIFLLACSVHVVRRRFGRLLWDSAEMPRIVGGQNVQSMRVKISDPHKKIRTLLSSDIIREFSSELASVMGMPTSITYIQHSSESMPQEF